MSHPFESKYPKMVDEPFEILQIPHDTNKTVENQAKSNVKSKPLQSTTTSPNEQQLTHRTTTTTRNEKQTGSSNPTKLPQKKGGLSKVFSMWKSTTHKKEVNETVASGINKSKNYSQQNDVPKQPKESLSFATGLKRSNSISFDIKKNSSRSPQEENGRRQNFGSGLRRSNSTLKARSYWESKQGSLKRSNSIACAINIDYDQSKQIVKRQSEIDSTIDYALNRTCGIVVPKLNNIDQNQNGHQMFGMKLQDIHSQVSIKFKLLCTF